VVAASLLVLLALSGCSSPDGKPASPSGGAGGGIGKDDGPGLPAVVSLNVTSPHFGGPAYTRDYAGVAKDDPTQLQGVPTGLARGPFQSCCIFTWVPAADLFVEDQFSALRVTLAWTNTQQDSANLDVAVCIPWYCGFPDVPDQTDQLGAQSETFDIVSGGHRQALDQGLQYFVGARYSNLVSANGVPFSVHVEVVPVANALAFLDPYEVAVPAGTTLTAEMVSPFRASDASAGVMVYGEDDRPLAYRTLSGGNGTRTALVQGPGSFVVVPFAYGGGLVRLHLDNATAEPTPARPLQETFGTVAVATAADPGPHEGSFTFDAPPGSMDTFPFFVYDGASAQYAGAGSGAISLSSSTGRIAGVDLAALGLVSPVGQTCLTCQTSVDWVPEHYLDDDGSYQVAYRSSQATGTFVLFTATYAR
jgi:hypothetical protein